MKSKAEKIATMIRDVDAKVPQKRAINSGGNLGMALIAEAIHDLASAIRGKSKPRKAKK